MEEQRSCKNGFFYPFFYSGINAQLKFKKLNCAEKIQNPHILYHMWSQNKNTLSVKPYK